MYLLDVSLYSASLSYVPCLSYRSLPETQKISKILKVSHRIRRRILMTQLVRGKDCFLIVPNNSDVTLRFSLNDLSVTK